MTPIKYIGEEQEGSKWANAVTKDWKHVGLDTKRGIRFVPTSAYSLVFFNFHN